MKSSFPYTEEVNRFYFMIFFKLLKNKKTLQRILQLHEWTLELKKLKEKLNRTEMSYLRNLEITSQVRKIKFPSKLISFFI